MIDRLQNNRTTKRERRSSMFGCKRPPQELLTSSVHKPGCLGQAVELKRCGRFTWRAFVVLPWRIFFSSLKLNRTYLLERMTGGYRPVLPQTWAVSGPPVSCTDACGVLQARASSDTTARPASRVGGTASSYSFTECSHLLVYCSAGFPA